MCHRGLKCVCVFGLSQNCVSLWEEHALQAFWSKRDKRPMEQTWTQIADWSWAQPWSAKSSPYADMWARINDWISFKTFYFELLLNFSSVQSLSRVWLFVTSWTTACQAFLSITSSWRLPKLMSIEWLNSNNLSMDEWMNEQKMEGWKIKWRRKWWKMIPVLLLLELISLSHL